jgi:hypothetical protein
MNSKKKADLQRRLSSTPGAKPPADLADRIKRDIPRHFTMNHQSDREQFSRSVTFNMRVAAAVLLVVSAAYISMQLFSVGGTRVMTPSTAPLARVKMSEQVVADQKKEAVAAPQSVVAQMRPADRFYDAPAAAPKVKADQVAFSDERRERKDADDTETGVTAGISGGVVGGTAGGVIGGARANEQPTQVAEAAPLAAPPPPPPALVAEPERVEAIAVQARPTAADAVAPAPPPAAAPIPAAPPAPQVARRSAPAPIPAAAPPAAGRAAAAPAPSPSLMKSAMAAELDFDARDEVFGISVDRGAFSRVKNAIERGEQPAAVNVEALVNYFAGPQKTRREVNLETEASPAPVGADGRRAILRYTIDTASAAVAEGASVPPVAADAKIEVVFEPKAVASHRLIGGDSESHKAEASLLKNTSVTALYELDLNDGLTSRQKVATVRLTYRSVADGREHTITSTIYGRDLARPWRAASRRHRLASLGAVWGETLKGAPSAPDVARRAEELAIQEPKDAKAQELASLATASSRLRTSAPTGSGR